eukprot:g46.t1
MPKDDDFEYSEVYSDDLFEYRHVTAPQYLQDRIRVLMKEEEWRRLGIRMSPGWMHYAIHPPESYILLFKRPRGFLDLPKTEQLQWTNKVNGLIAERNERNNERRASLRSATVWRNDLSKGDDNELNESPSNKSSPLDSILHLFY